MHHPESKSVRTRGPHREVHWIPVGTRPDLAALVPALGLVPGVDSFVLLDGEGWGTRMLAFDPERVLSVEGGSPFKKLRSLLTPETYSGGRVEGRPAAGPMLFGYLSYDAARSLERLPDLAKDDLRLPVARFILPRYVIGAGPEGIWASVPAGDSTDFILEALHRSALLPDAAPTASAGTLRDARSTLGREGYMEAVERVKEYVRAGDVFQVNISQRFEVPYDGDPLALYGALRRRNPSPFGGMLSFPGLVAVSSSPERLVDLRGRRASTRPIAGTYPKGAGAALLLDPKERAEHTMILDLERNDLGRTAAYGTVRVEEFMTTETYSHVVHIVSEVVGELAEGRDATDLLAGMFPGGTITGCPKVRCMEIIEELEPVRRGLYTGSFGYLSLDGSAMDMNISIRTILLKDGTAYAQAGGGIVADSVPAREYRESVAKAAALLECLGARVP
jgi:para-aminobenzoate synthetase component 1